MAPELHSIAPEIRDYIARNFLFSDKGFQYSDDQSFLEEGIIDSLGIIELVSFVEKTYGISVADQGVPEAARHRVEFPIGQTPSGANQGDLLRKAGG
jgi:acyl carrier protein